MKNLCTCLLLALLAVSCKQIQQATDVITQPTPREVYERRFDETNIAYQEWVAMYQSSQQDSLEAPLPFSLSGQLQAPNIKAFAYDVLIQQGERLFVTVVSKPDSLQFFLDAFRKDQKDPVVYSEENNNTFTYLAERTDTLKVVIQPELYASGNFQLQMYTQPSYAFPVAGADNRNVQSFWGAARDGGRRSHEGIDIFAARGTPVVAAIDGRVSSTGKRGLGGKQVWLRDGLFGASLYYAHLDSIAVRNGMRVKVGDTLGFVGNSGNARTTAPHLHFGIYKGYSGAVNPYPFVAQQKIPEQNIKSVETAARIGRNNAELRTGPSTKFNQIAGLRQRDTVAVYGQTENWYHIKLQDSVGGFMHRSLLELLP
ncbi:M23 family metallopeptidase [Altibacter sp. HG106]|uniref:M23 family metallopeptidase n=1 Tax=Altibacter sp. HG106 TaxID=3023937 RepID=UPI00234FC72C|nr:M23 family metallopeptidase [Altibacter sp. HG106]MDC7995181.1 M23 family metallopeptidase [Altibacter sp. HG106]